MGEGGEGGLILASVFVHNLLTPLGQLQDEPWQAGLHCPALGDSEGAILVQQLAETGRAASNAKVEGLGCHVHHPSASPHQLLQGCQQLGLGVQAVRWSLTSGSRHIGLFQKRGEQAPVSGIEPGPLLRFILILADGFTVFGSGIQYHIGYGDVQDF